MAKKLLIGLCALIAISLLSSCARGIPASSESSYAQGYTDSMKYYISERGEAQGMVLFEEALRDLEYRKGVREAFSDFVAMQEFAAVENESIYNEIIDGFEKILLECDFNPNEEQIEKLKNLVESRSTALGK